MGIKVEIAGKYYVQYINIQTWILCAVFKKNDAPLENQGEMKLRKTVAKSYFSKLLQIP